MLRDPENRWLSKRYHSSCQSAPQVSDINGATCRVAHVYSSTALKARSQEGEQLVRAADVSVLPTVSVFLVVVQ